jgi:hypothetical protein
MTSYPGLSLFCFRISSTCEEHVRLFSMRRAFFGRAHVCLSECPVFFSHQRDWYTDRITLSIAMKEQGDDIIPLPGFSTNHRLRLPYDDRYDFIYGF